MKIAITAALAASIAVSAHAQDVRTAPPPPLVLVHPDQPAAAPVVLTLQDALQRARELDAQYQSVVADAAIASGDRAQAKAGLLPTLSATTQYLGNSPTPNNVNPNGRYVSLDSVKIYHA